MIDRLLPLVAAHILIASAALALGLVLALPLGVYAARHRRVEQGVLGFASLIQTIPSLALLALFYPLLLAFRTLTGSATSINVRNGISGTVNIGPVTTTQGLTVDNNSALLINGAINFGAECEACPSDGQPFCLTLVADQILAEQLDGVTLVEVGGNNCMGCESPTDTTDLSDTCEVDPNL